ncbi:hypothetical protein ACSBR1_042878 [Camellia fascicularis]
MVVANLGNISGWSLVFEALLTKIFKVFHVRLVSEAATKITSPISEYTLTRAGSAENLLGSLNMVNAPIDDAFEDPNDNAIPQNEQPQYWIDYLAIEQERHNQHVQWEHQMANQFNTLGN